jgi:NAD(P)-dependent dehydrogenase (short-subunit alcohol dehydrogenase family)
MDIKEKTVFVTGATSGLGLGMPRLFADRGANVVLVGRRGNAVSPRLDAGHRVPL